LRAIKALICNRKSMMRKQHRAELQKRRQAAALQSALRAQNNSIRNQQSAIRNS
jgi:hypothetical protein